MSTGIIGKAKDIIGGMGPGAAMKAVAGVAQIAGSFIGGRKRRQEQRQATAELARRKQKFEQLDTSNPYENISNPYVNLTVNTQAADFAAQQSAQGAANIMGNLAASAGGGGIAALAQAMANSQNQQAQQASASIAQQESRNQMLSAQGEARRQSMVAQGELQSRKMEQNKVSTLLGMAQERKAAADQARADATNQAISGLGNVAGGIAQGKLELDE
jgi:hypothetical protein|tara:strand:+ start:886 stop:1536 length:651 start_codon:yes stop_codon:yes gene_type:complete